MKVSSAKGSLVHKPDYFTKNRKVSIALQVQYQWLSLSMFIL